MSNELNNIFNQQEDSNTPEELLKYLQGELDKNAEHQLEQRMVEDPFLNDAAEGLALIKDKDSINNTTQHLNKNLKQHLHKKRRKSPSLFFNQSWIYVAVIILLLLIIAAYIIIVRIG